MEMVRVYNYHTGEILEKTFTDHEKEILHETVDILGELAEIAERMNCGSIYNTATEVGFDVADVEDASGIIQQLFEFTNKLQLSE